MYLLMSDINEV